MLNVGPWELMVILLIALIVVGPQKLPELSRQIGKGLREFKRVQDEVKDMVTFDLFSEPEPQRPAPSSTPSPTSTTSTTSVSGVHRTPRPAPVAPVEDVSPGEGGAPTQGHDAAAGEPSSSAE
jgi:TatA/E family protein of Tat protein translocase